MNKNLVILLGIIALWFFVIQKGKYSANKTVQSTTTNEIQNEGSGGVSKYSNVITAGRSYTL